MSAPDLHASSDARLVPAPWPQWIALAIPFFSRNSRCHFPPGQPMGSDCLSSSVALQGERVRQRCARGQGPKCSSEASLSPFGQKGRKPFGPSCLQLIVEVRQLSACIFQQDFAVDGQRRCKEIHTQNADEQPYAAATVEEERLLRCGEEVEPAHEAKQHQNQCRRRDE